MYGWEVGILCFDCEDFVGICEFWGGRGCVGVIGGSEEIIDFLKVLCVFGLCFWFLGGLFGVDWGCIGLIVDRDVWGFV